jgi:N-methylhydantoinase A/oxoprolinase/acetone carboxylase beta subunit
MADPSTSAAADPSASVAAGPSSVMAGLDPAIPAHSAAEAYGTSGTPASDTRIDIRHYADVCYIGQSYHLEVPLTSRDAGAIYEAFLTAHARVYGHSTSVPAKIVNLRSVHRAALGTVATGATHRGTPRPPTTRTIRIAAGTVQAVIWHRDAFTAETRVPGPAVIEQADTTTLVEPGWTARLAAGDALILERQGDPSP